MPIIGEKMEFNRDGVWGALELSGVYLLVDDDGGIVYIGYAGNIRERLALHLDGSLGACSQNATHFQEEATSVPARLCKDLLDEYQLRLGVLPTCNEPSL